MKRQLRGDEVLLAKGTFAAQRIESAAPELATLAGIDDDGRVRVLLAGAATSVVARIAATLEFAAMRRAVETRADVLVVFPFGDRSQPVIANLVQDRLDMREGAPVAGELTLEPRLLEVQSDGRRLIIQAHDELLLLCGKASMSLKRNGHVVVRGTRIETDAEECNRIKGASVRVN